MEGLQKQNKDELLQVQKEIQQVKLEFEDKMIDLRKKQGISLNQIAEKLDAVAVNKIHKTL